MLATATITYDLANYVGLPHYKGTSVTATTNIPGDTVVDTDGNKIRLGSGRGTIDANGKGSVVVWVPGTGSNPASWQTYLTVRYRDPRAHGGATERTFGPFTITADADLADLVAEQDVPPNYTTGVLAEMTALRDETALISGLTGEDAAVAALVNSSSSDTKAALSATFAPKSSTSQKVQFGGLTLGDTPPSGRIPVKSSQGLSAAQTGTGNHVGHLYQSIVVGGGWDADAPPDPGFVWGCNFFTTTGTNPGDADGVVALYGGLIEADIRAPSGSSLGTVIGLQAEAAFQSASAGADVDKMVSLQVANPVRKDGATAGTATTVIGLLVRAVAPGSLGSTTAYTALIEGPGTVRSESDILVQMPGTGSASDSLTLKAGASQAGNLLRFRGFDNSSVGRVTTGGIVATFGRGVHCEGRAQMVQVGDVHPGDANAAAVTLGSASDVTAYRASAGVLAMRDQQVLRTGRGTTAQRPNAATVGAGAQYYDQTISRMLVSNGSVWTFMSDGTAA